MRFHNLEFIDCLAVSVSECLALYWRRDICVYYEQEVCVQKQAKGLDERDIGILFFLAGSFICGYDNYISDGDAVWGNDKIAKLVVQVVGTIENYILSKLFVFSKR